jgi:phage terminase large subunit-like protein
VATTASQLGNVREIPFDPWSFRESAEMLQERGVPMVEFPQTQGRMGPASENVYELVTEGRIVHNGDREARRQILATVAAATDRGGWMISKRKSKEKIDFTVAFAMMADRAVTLRNAKPVRRGAAFL